MWTHCAKYRVNVVAWGAQLSPLAGDKVIANRREQMEEARKAGVRLCARRLRDGPGDAAACVVPVETGPRPIFNCTTPFEIRIGMKTVLNQIAASGVDLNAATCWTCTATGWGCPGCRTLSNSVWIELLGRRCGRWMVRADGPAGVAESTALHFDEPGGGAYGLQAAIRRLSPTMRWPPSGEWLGKRPEKIWREAGVPTLDGFNYRAFVLAHGVILATRRLCAGVRAFPVVHHRRVRPRAARSRAAKVARISLLDECQPGARWIKLPFLPIWQDFMTTEVQHEARSRSAARAAAGLQAGDAFRQPVASTPTAMTGTR